MTARQLEKRRKSPTARRAIGAGAKRAAKSKAVAPYHHGALSEALLKAAETVLERDGLAGLTLRAAAREAGVSHAAPTHHFGDMTGLLSELAASGFRKFGAALEAAAASKTPPSDRMEAMGEAYVDFARTYPGMFMLMFRSERLDVARPSLKVAMKEAFGWLTRGASARRGASASQLELAADVVRSWSLVHGFAMLTLDHRLDHLRALFPAGTSESDVLRAVLTMK